MHRMQRSLPVSRRSRSPHKRHRSCSRLQLARRNSKVIGLKSLIRSPSSGLEKHFRHRRVESQWRPISRPQWSHTAAHILPLKREKKRNLTVIVSATSLLKIGPFRPEFGGTHSVLGIALKRGLFAHQRRWAALRNAGRRAHFRSQMTLGSRKEWSTCPFCARSVMCLLQCRDFKIQFVFASFR
jgi:hypothetical protein